MSQDWYMEWCKEKVLHGRGIQSNYGSDKVGNCRKSSIRLMHSLREIPAISHPDVIVGDFDSIHTESRKFFAESAQQSHMEDQDSTDLTKALSLLRKDPTMV